MTFVTLIVTFLASFGVPVSHCGGALTWGDATCDVRPMGPPPESPEWVRQSGARKISNGL
jgi:hypothetical protein